MSLLTTADWLVIAAYFIVLYAVVFRYSATNRREPDRVLPRRPQCRLVHRRRVDLRDEHRLRASRGACRQRRIGRVSRGAVRAHRGVRAASARLAVRAVLPALRRVHDARVPRSALLLGRALLSRGDLDRRLRAHEDLRDDRGRRHRVRGADGHRLLDGRRHRRARDGRLHRHRRHARGARIRHVPNVRDDRRRNRRHDRRARTRSAAGASCARPRRPSS